MSNKHGNWALINVNYLFTDDIADIAKFSIAHWTNVVIGETKDDGSHQDNDDHGGD